MKELYVIHRQNKDNEEDFGICYSTSNEEVHYTDLLEAQKDKKRIEVLYGDEEVYTILKLTEVEE